MDADFHNGGNSFEDNRPSADDDIDERALDTRPNRSNRPLTRNQTSRSIDPLNNNGTAQFDGRDVTDSRQRHQERNNSFLSARFDIDEEERSSKRRANKTSRRGNGLITIFTVLILVAGYTAMQWRYMNTLDRVEERLDVAEAQAEQALKAAIPPATVNDAMDSVYLVLREGRPHGTAFVIDRERGILATAAHVITDLDFYDEEKTAEIVNRHTGKKISVAGAKVHAGYGAFKDLVEFYQPILPESKPFNLRPAPLVDLPHDAALMLVDPIDPDTGENILGPDMPVAPDERLLALAPGDAIALLGFPADVINPGAVDFGAAPRSDRGIVSAMLAPIDLVEESGDARFDSLIIHRMTGAPGMSGGPILDRDGYIVGIHTHGVTTPSSNGDSVAQRADVIRDMLTPLREEDQVANILIPEWRRRLQRWPRAQDVLPALLRLAYDDPNPQFPEMTIGEIVARDEKKEFRTIIDRRFGERMPDFRLAAEELDTKEARLAARRSRNAREIPVNASQGFVLGGPAQFAMQRVLAPEAFDHIVFAFDYTVGQYPMCPLKLFSRWVGDKKLRATGNAGFPSLLFQAERDENGEPLESKKSKTMEIVAKRSSCPFADDRFFIGIVSWDPKNDELKSDNNATDQEQTEGEAGATEGETENLGVRILAGLADAGGDLKAFASKAIGAGKPDTFVASLENGGTLQIIPVEALVHGPSDEAVYDVPLANVAIDEALGIERNAIDGDTINQRGTDNAGFFSSPIRVESEVSESIESSTK